MGVMFVSKSLVNRYLSPGGQVARRVPHPFARLWRKGGNNPVMGFPVEAPGFSPVNWSLHHLGALAPAAPSIRKE